MPLPNRVAPDGTLHAVTARGTLMGNRGGCFHRDDKTLKPQPWVSMQWIACRLEFKGRRRALFQPGRYTELFFLDEATALAAGHRPCFECRRPAALQFQTLWATVRGLAARPSVTEMDRVLQQERLTPQKTKARHRLRFADVPPGAMIEVGGRIALVTMTSLAPWSFEGYGPCVPYPSNDMYIDMLTPPAVVAIFRAGYLPIIHPSVTAP